MLDKLTQLHKSKFVKCFLIAIVLVFSYEVSKPKAIAPLLPYVLPVVGGIVVGELAEMGVKWAGKAVAKKQSDNFAEMALNEKNIYGFDFMKTNPYRNKDGSLIVNPSVNDMAKVAGLIAGTAAGYMFGPDENADGIPDGCTPTIPTNGAPVTWELAKSSYSQGTIDESKRVYYDFAVRYVQSYYVPVSADTVEVFYKSKATGAVITSTVVKGSSGFKPQVSTVIAKDGATPYLHPAVKAITSSGTTDFSHTSNNLPIKPENVAAPLPVSQANAKQAGSELMVCDEMMYPDTLEKVYPAPMDMSSSYQMPNAADIKPQPIVILNVFPPSDNEGGVSWEDVQKAYPDPAEFSQLVDESVNYDIGNVNNNPITIGEINNHYTDINYPIKIIDFKPDIEEIKPPTVEPPVIVPDPDVPAIPNEDVDDLDHSMWQVMRNTYNYLDDGIDSSLAAMKGITDSASGITTYLGQTMGWLPAEWRAVFTSAFVLGVFAHFLRR